MNKSDFDDLLSRVKEIEELLHFPSMFGHIQKANHLAVSVARRTPGPIPHLAMVVADAVNQVRLTPKDREAQNRFTAAISQLREAIQLKRSDAAE